MGVNEHFVRIDATTPAPGSVAGNQRFDPNQSAARLSKATFRMKDVHIAFAQKQDGRAIGRFIVDEKKRSTPGSR